MLPPPHTHTYTLPNGFGWVFKVLPLETKYHENKQTSDEQLANSWHVPTTPPLPPLPFCMGHRGPLLAKQEGGFVDAEQGGGPALFLLE